MKKTNKKRDSRQNRSQTSSFRCAHKQVKSSTPQYYYDRERYKTLRRSYDLDTRLTANAYDFTVRRVLSVTDDFLNLRADRKVEKYQKSDSIYERLDRN